MNRLSIPKFLYLFQRRTSSCGYVIPEDDDIDQILFQILTKIIIVLNLKYLYHLQILYCTEDYA